MALVFCRTVRAAVSVEAFQAYTHSSPTKAAAEEPSSEKKLVVADKKVVQAPRIGTHRGLDVGVEARSALMLAAERGQQFVDAGDVVANAAGPRLFVLRI